jgi:hypothetical protein
MRAWLAGLLVAATAACGAPSGPTEPQEEDTPEAQLEEAARARAILDRFEPRLPVFEPY